MAGDRASILRHAETLLKEGQPEKAAELYRDVAEREFSAGFYAKAAALFRKILSIRASDDGALVRLGEIAARGGRLGEAREHFTAAAARRTERGDAAGAGEITAKRQAIETAIAMPLITADIEADEGAAAAQRVLGALAADPAAGAAIATAAERLATEHPVAASACVDILVDHALAANKTTTAVDLLRRFARVLPERVPVLLRLVEVANDSGLDAIVREAQAGLADAYLAEGRAHEARIIAEDLVTWDRSDHSHVARLRQSLQLLGVEDVEAVIAERLNAPVVDPLAFLEAAAQVPEPAAAAQPSTEETGTEEEAPELDEVFAGLRAAADADPLSDESDHYIEVARGHIDAGRTEEAIEALLHAVKWPKRRFRCAAMLAQLYRDLNDIPRAIEWYERGAEAPPASPEDGARLMYELGDLLETMGEHARALAVFLEIEAETPGFLDVTARIARLAPDQVGG